MRIRRLFSTSVALCVTLSMSLGTCVTFASDAVGGPSSEDQAGRTENSTSDAAPHMLQGQVGAFGVLSDEIQSRMGMLVGQNSANQVAVTEILPGTAAFDCGIHKGDRVLDAHLQGNALNVTISRNGNIFRAHLTQVTPKLVAQTAKKDNTPTKPFALNASQIQIGTSANDNTLVPEKAAVDKSKPLTAAVNQFALRADQNYRNLANYNLELIVDRSMSMRTKDCPDGLSRWSWCGLQAAALANTLSPYTQSGMTIVPFATEYDVFEHATAQHIEYMFNNVQNQFGTRLYEPLAERLDNYFAHRTANTKPLVVVIVTDGQPFPRVEPGLVRNELINSSRKMGSPGEVTVIFCQIGGRDRKGEDYLLDLDQNLVAEGAKYHYVHTISFEELSEAGLGPSVAASINQYAPQYRAPVAVPSVKGKAKPATAKPTTVAPRARHA